MKLIKNEPNSETTPKVSEPGRKRKRVRKPRNKLLKKLNQIKSEIKEEQKKDLKLSGAKKRRNEKEIIQIKTEPGLVIKVEKLDPKPTLEEPQKTSVTEPKAILVKDEKIEEIKKRKRLIKRRNKLVKKIQQIKPELLLVKKEKPDPIKRKVVKKPKKRVKKSQKIKSEENIKKMEDLFQKYKIGRKLKSWNAGNKKKIDWLAEFNWWRKNRTEWKYRLPKVYEKEPISEQVLKTMKKLKKKAKLQKINNTLEIKKEKITKPQKKNAKNGSKLEENKKRKLEEPETKPAKKQKLVEFLNEKKPERKPFVSKNLYRSKKFHLFVKETLKNLKLSKIVYPKSARDALRDIFPKASVVKVPHENYEGKRPYLMQVVLAGEVLGVGSHTDRKSKAALRACEVAIQNIVKSTLDNPNYIVEMLKKSEEVGSETVAAMDGSSYKDFPWISLTSFALYQMFERWESLDLFPRRKLKRTPKSKRRVHADAVGSVDNKSVVDRGTESKSVKVVPKVKAKGSALREPSKKKIIKTT